MSTTLLSNEIPQVHKRERRKEARPGELLDAALSLFASKGYSATKVEDVAASAGVSKGTLFLYFPSKEDLFKAVIRANLADHFPTWNQEFEEFEGSTPDMLEYALVSWWQRIGSTDASGITKLVMSEANNFPEVVQFYEQEVIRPGQELFKRILKRGMDSGEFAAFDPEQAVHSLVSAILYVNMWKHSLACNAMHNTLNPETFLRNHAHLLALGWRRS
ncbi:MAG: TetR/AcrR family transcriptional regulator [Betaproteobacteria bacterium]|nr:TetR/AcrR family transcriptional regulator [Betaproteobacteria bacterium]